MENNTSGKCEQCGCFINKLRHGQRFCCKSCSCKFHKRNASIEQKEKWNMNSPYYKIRFSVFNRDCFRCVYCGRSSTDDDKLVLNLEHMSPANGEEIDWELMSEDDLVTSCRECNVGKSNTILIDVDKIKQIKIDIKFRSVLRKYWEQEMKFKYPNFQVYYEGYIEKQIDKIKENLL